MSTFLKQNAFNDAILYNIISHPAWLGNISGLKAEKMLRGRNKPYLYVLRAGEHNMEYYVTFIHRDLSVRHQPFVITFEPKGWWYENYGVNGPYQHATIDDVIHLIMHCEESDCTPFVHLPPSSNGEKYAAKTLTPRI